MPELPLHCGKIETIDAYIEAQDDFVKPYLKKVRQIIRQAIPLAQERISWGMPTFWSESNIIHFAAAKKHLGLYPGAEAMVYFAQRLESFGVSKATLRIPYQEPLPEELISDLARWCFAKYGKSVPERERC